jgi:hypothetical protein
MHGRPQPSDVEARVDNEKLPRAGMFGMNTTRAHFGRGPRSAHGYNVGPNVIVCVLERTLTTVEQHARAGLLDAIPASRYSRTPAPLCTRWRLTVQTRTGLPTILDT